MFQFLFYILLLVAFKNFMSKSTSIKPVWKIYWNLWFALSNFINADKLWQSTLQDSEPNCWCFLVDFFKTTFLTLSALEVTGSGAEIGEDGASYLVFMLVKRIENKVGSKKIKWSFENRSLDSKFVLVFKVQTFIIAWLHHYSAEWAKE